ncbi:MAG: hypothetical protein ACLGIR_00305 [Actinomycetes bacterium]
MSSLDTSTLRRATLDEHGWREPLALAVGLDLLAIGAVAVLRQDPSLLVLSLPALVVGLPVVVLLLRAPRERRRRVALAALLAAAGALGTGLLAGGALARATVATLVSAGLAVGVAAAGFMLVDALAVRRRLARLSSTVRTAAAGATGLAVLLLAPIGAPCPPLTGGGSACVAVGGPVAENLALAVLVAVAVWSLLSSPRWAPVGHRFRPRP